MNQMNWTGFGLLIMMSTTLLIEAILLKFEDLKLPGTGLFSRDTCHEYFFVVMSSWS